MVKNLWKILCLGSALFFAGCDSCTQKEAEEIKNNYNLTIYSPQQKNDSKPVENLKKNNYTKKVQPDLPKDNSIYTPSLSEKVMTQDILNSDSKDIPLDSVGYAGIGISINSIIKSILPNLTEPTFKTIPDAKLPLTPDFSSNNHTAPVETYLDNQQKKVGFYINVPLD